MNVKNPILLGEKNTGSLFVLIKTEKQKKKKKKKNKEQTFKVLTN